MPTLRIVHAERPELSVSTKVKTSVLDALLDHNYPIEHACGGFCACTTCHIRIRSPNPPVSPAQGDELDRLSRLENADAHSRLACQTKILGDLTVEVVNLDD